MTKTENRLYLYAYKAAHARTGSAEHATNTAKFVVKEYREFAKAQRSHSLLARLFRRG